MTNVHRILAKMGDSAGKILQNSYVIVTELVTRVQYVIRQDCTDRALTFFLKILQSSKIKKYFLHIIYVAMAHHTASLTDHSGLLG